MGIFAKLAFEYGNTTLQWSPSDC